MRNLVIGLGQIGTAIQAILGCDGYDPFKDQTAEGKYEVLHICFPYSESFNEDVIAYSEMFEGEYIIIHSTVPVGTARKLDAVSSPCRGIHPHLEEGIRTFVKFFGGKEAVLTADIFFDKGIDVISVVDSDSVEAMKLWDTTIYGLNIVLEKEIYRYCKEHRLDFDLVYKWANTTYNDGYEKLKRPEYKKYILEHKDGPIGGHCIIPNCDLMDSWVTKLIKEKNDGLKKS